MIFSTKKRSSSVLKKISLLQLSLFFIFSTFSPKIFAEEVTPRPDIQLAMIGNTLVAIDEIPLPEFAMAAEELITKEALELEREILLRKLAESQSETKEIPLVLSKSIPQIEKSKQTQLNPSLSALSHNTFFDDLDQEIIDPFRSMDNLNNFFTRLVDYLDYKVGLYGEYDDNIFLTPSDKESDFKTVLNQSIEIEYPLDKFYFDLLYAANLDFYGQADETIDTQNVAVQLSYFPFNHLSLGVSDQLIKVGNSDIATSIGDQTLSLGYVTNNVRTELEYELWENGFFEIFYNNEHVDFSSGDVSIFINRNTNILDVRLKHRYNPIFSNYMGYRLKDVVFSEIGLKNQESSIFFYGLDYELPGLLTFFGEVASESKSFKNRAGGIEIVPFGIIIPFDERRRQDNNVNYLVGVESNFSRFNNISLSFNSRVLESSRPEFSQYLAETFSVNSRNFIDSKTIFFTSHFLEVQNFDSKDGFGIFFLDGDATTKVYATGVTLRRILNEWLYFDIGYTYVRRTTDFVGEGSNNSRFRFGAHATF